MKAIANLLIIVSEGARMCRAGVPWELLEDCSFYSGSWSGSDHQQLLEAISESTSLSAKHPQAPSHTSNINEPATGRLALDRSMMEDHPWSFLTDLPGIGSIPTDASLSLPGSHPDLGISNTPTPGNSFAHAPEKVAAEFFRALPMGDSPNPYVMSYQSASKRLKLTVESMGKVTSSINKITKAAPQHLSLLNHIKMKEEETKVHSLIFDKNVFKFPNLQDSNFIIRREMIESNIQKRVDKSNPHLSAEFTIRKEKTGDIVKAFNSRTPRTQEAPSPVDVANKALVKFHKFLPVWKKKQLLQEFKSFETPWIASEATAGTGLNQPAEELVCWRAGASRYLLAKE
ncbi:hypothetical protein PCASD_20362 [Puccinia coronata f. sp. avenae]|uniref:Uncharacterized protein n=1 Tax=Puccinia coronata f. sp. avenae TaxID=200324 RepID=A0A2N5SQD6_9BASI|nr:hypothetical protein PCASD_20362 [Puccinia coronata f. sp. avenae]